MSNVIENQDGVEQLSHFERMLQLVEAVFDVKNDPSQLDVNEEVLEYLKTLHPATVSELDDGKGPVAWVLLIPTTLKLMHQFIGEEISEQEMYDLTKLETQFEALYLCSALVLEEYRNKGIAKRLALEAIEKIRLDYPIKALFVWTFTKEGDLVAEKIANWTSLPLFKLSK